MLRAILYVSPSVRAFYCCRLVSENSGHWNVFVWMFEHNFSCLIGSVCWPQHKSARQTFQVILSFMKLPSILNRWRRGRRREETQVPAASACSQWDRSARQIAGKRGKCTRRKRFATAGACCFVCIRRCCRNSRWEFRHSIARIDYVRWMMKCLSQLLARFSA